ncbi:TetR/AcrR family transcriptional regulator [Parerythrobacter jejuensis]|uniref:TetR family transcriptional regulator n=1 Tax=Parerythrobacter jejuensis TaxID=795812 RepID=A0A845AR37_9SPHN|nr:TetR/AcrR family transcriptional regulator [Parerythrobacter jejuensis]MXP32770.1 TetR family transcriptional regulator [Parerythrobacter jejuensis]
MSKTRLSRESLLPLIAAHVLEHGLADLSLRPLAKAAGTSDRMLIYHFGNKDQLVAAVLTHLSEMFAGALDTAFPQGRAISRRACAEQVIAVTADPAFAPFFRLWWDIVSGCARGDDAYLRSAGAIMDRLLDWVEAHLPANDPDPGAGARAVLTVIEGAQMLAAVGRAEIGSGGIAGLPGL